MTKKGATRLSRPTVDQGDISPAANNSPRDKEIPQLSSELRDLGKWGFIKLKPEAAEAAKMADDPIVDIDPAAFSEDEE